MYIFIVIEVELRIKNSFLKSFGSFFLMIQGGNQIININKFYFRGLESEIIIYYFWLLISKNLKSIFIKN